jgi:hypothetical protein
MRTGIASLIVVATISLISSCFPSEPNGPTPVPGGAAFEMRVLGAEECPSDLRDQSCVRVGVTNRGEAGDGRCRLRATRIDPVTGEEENIWGRWIRLSDMGSGTAMETITPWRSRLPAVGYCEPGLLL